MGLDTLRLACLDSTWHVSLWVLTRGKQALTLDTLQMGLDTWHVSISTETQMGLDTLGDPQETLNRRTILKRR